MSGKKIVDFPTYNVSDGFAHTIVKYQLDDESISVYSRTKAIEKIAYFETFNSITKDDLVHALRWLFEHYDFPEG